MSHSALAASVRHLRGVMAAQRHHDDSDEQLLHAFADHRDESAFAVLVRRHGPMVLHVCRRVLGHQQDAEDAFQATFLVLARNAATLRKKTALASFLHGTAYRLALSAKRSAARRRKHEGRIPVRPPTNPATELLWREVQTLLDEEIARLPEIYRSVFILCVLENVGQAEAARRLGLKEGTLSSRLTEARKRLQRRLTRRGVELTALLAAAALTTETASALPATLLATTTGGAVSPAVAALADSGSMILGIGKIKLAAALVLAASVLTGAGLWAYRSPTTPSGAPPQPAAKEKADRPAQRTPREENEQTVEVSGHVLDPDGKPVRGAKLVFVYGSAERIPKKVWAVSAAEGRFAFTVPVKKVDAGQATPWKYTYVVAAAEGYGFAAAQLGKPGAADLTLRLVKDDVPIRGRVINLEGKPIAGVRVRINDFISTPEKGDLTAWLDALKANKSNPGTEEYTYLMGLFSPAFDLLIPPVTTGADGRFEMKGIGRERVAHLLIEGPTIATRQFQVMTRSTEAIRLPKNKEHPEERINAYHGADGEFLVAPTRPIVGVVRDKDTGKPLAGVTIETNRIAPAMREIFIHTTTDKDGRYRLVGLPKGEGNEIAATTNDYRPVGLPKGEGNEIAATTIDQPYLAVVQKVGNPLGLEPVTVDFALKRGIWVKGRVTEKTTGKPLRAANVDYFCFRDNPNANAFTQGGHFNSTWSREDASFRIAALPGHGLIAVRDIHDHYVMAAGAEQIKGPRDEAPYHYFHTTPRFCLAEDYHSLIEINPKPGDESIVYDVTLDPGRTLRGTVFGPDDKPLAGARVSNLKDGGGWENVPLPGADFTVEGLKPNKPRMLQFVHEGKKLSGYLLLRSDEKDPLQVRLESWGTLTGRLVTPRGEPLTGKGVHVNCRVDGKGDAWTLWAASREVRPDKEGRFRIEGLTAGLKYELHIIKGSYHLEIVSGESKDLTIEAGETKDLGELKVKPME